MKLQPHSGDGPATPSASAADERTADGPASVTKSRTSDVLPAPAPDGRPRRRSVPDPVLGAAGVLIFAGVVEALPRLGLVSDRHLPPVSDMARALAGEAGGSAFWTALTDTLQGWGIGLAIAVVAGTALGLLLGSVEVLRKATASTIEFLRPIPSVALVPLAVLVYGTGLRSTLLLVVYASFWPVLLQVLSGVRDIDPVARDTAASYRLSPLARLRYLLWPTTLPYFMTGLRLAASVALILAVSAELIIGGSGLGSLIASAQAADAVPETYALVAVTGLLGLCVNIVFRVLERTLLSWHTSVRKEGTA
ncbi:ABC transporter permease [Streptomyces sp. NPDC057509]|uniref:ABC transporter permease n=1 Tax=Streptomyces sp. NPDC057509 TaxID=3346152 RepID=UPI0036B5048E